MSIQNHPNINAAGLAADVTSSINRYARGKAVGKALQCAAVRELIVEFCTRVSIELDKEFDDGDELVN